MKLIYQGIPGAYSSLAAKIVGEKIGGSIDNIEGLQSFEHVREKIDNEHIAVLPIENSYAGTIHANIYNFLHYNVVVVGEYILPIRHCLLSKSSDVEQIKVVYSHPQALAQTYNFCKAHQIEQHQYGDTAGAASFVAESEDSSIAAVASTEAASRYGLNIVAQDIQDHDGNQTRFIIVAPANNSLNYSDSCGKFAVLFQTRNIPGALYKSLGAFATNGVDLTKIESLPAQKDPFSYMFWLEAKGDEQDENVQNALTELSYYSSHIRVIGYY